MTDQNLKLKFFGLHLGCPLVRGGSRGTLQSVSIDRFGKECAQTVFDELIATVRIDNCYLLLKPLSEITDEDALHAAALAGYCDETFTLKRYRTHVEIDSDVLNGWVSIFFSIDGSSDIFNSDELHGDEAIKIIDFLRSKGYCLPYMGKDPFKEGWAVPATTKQP